MKRYLCVSLLFFIAGHAFGWGQTGHRVVGEIAEQHLTRKARKNLRQLLGNESLAMASTWMDFIKSDSAYDHTHTWHYVTIPDGQTYEASEKEPQGDAIQTVDRLMAELKSGALDRAQQVVAVRYLVHLIGDIHQPLHVGRGDDKGGNAVAVTWFRQSSNLHRVWDSDIIDGQQMSYTEWVRVIDHPTKAEIRQWQATGIRDWAYESMSYRPVLYDLPPENRLFYRYSYDHLATVELRLLQAGVRLAGVLNELFG